MYKCFYILQVNALFPRFSAYELQIMNANIYNRKHAHILKCFGSQKVKLGNAWVWTPDHYLLVWPWTIRRIKQSESWHSLSGVSNCSDFVCTTRHDQ
jgi:hypothetical protein